MFLTTRAVAGYMPGLEREAKEMIHDLYVRSKAGTIPINPQRFASRASLNNILTLTFGFRTESIDDKLVSDTLRLSREFMCVSHSLGICSLSFALTSAIVVVKEHHGPGCEPRRLHPDAAETPEPHGDARAGPQPRVGRALRCDG